MGGKKLGLGGKKSTKLHGPWFHGRAWTRGRREKVFWGSYSTIAGPAIRAQEDTQVNLQETEELLGGKGGKK